jgi:hypothetical protein
MFSRARVVQIRGLYFRRIVFAGLRGCGQRADEWSTDLPRKEGEIVPVVDRPGGRD